MGRDVEVAGFGHTSSGKLKEIATRFTEIERIPKALLKIKDRGTGPSDKRQDGRDKNYRK